VIQHYYRNVMKNRMNRQACLTKYVNTLPLKYVLSVCLYSAYFFSSYFSPAPLCPVFEPSLVLGLKSLQLSTFGRGHRKKLTAPYLLPLDISVCMMNLRLANFPVLLIVETAERNSRQDGAERTDRSILNPKSHRAII